jgi:deferrochelatase/peroxidase EfeB
LSHRTSTAAVQAAAFADLARNDAREISELFQRSIDHEILRRHFPGQSALAWFTLANEDAEDLDKYIQRIAALATAGHTADPAEVSETRGLTLTHQLAQALRANDDYTRDTNGKFSETQSGGSAKQDPDPPTPTADTPDFSTHTWVNFCLELAISFSGLGSPSFLAVHPVLL